MKIQRKRACALDAIKKIRQQARMERQIEREMLAEMRNRKTQYLRRKTPPPQRQRKKPARQQQQKKRAAAPGAPVRRQQQQRKKCPAPARQKPKAKGKKAPAAAAAPAPAPASPARKKKSLKVRVICAICHLPVFRYPKASSPSSPSSSSSGSDDVCACRQNYYFESLLGKKFAPPAEGQKQKGRNIGPARGAKRPRHPEDRRANKTPIRGRKKNPASKKRKQLQQRGD